MVALGIELSAARLSAVRGRPALDYRCQTFNDHSVRTVGIEPTISWSQAKRDTKLRYVLMAAREGVEPYLLGLKNR